MLLIQVLLTFTLLVSLDNVTTKGYSNYILSKEIFNHAKRIVIEMSGGQYYEIY